MCAACPAFSRRGRRRTRPDHYSAGRYVDLAVPLRGGLDVELGAQVFQRRRSGVDRETVGQGRVGPHAKAADQQANAVRRVDFHLGGSAEDRDGARVEHDFGLSRGQIKLLPFPEAVSTLDSCFRAGPAPSTRATRATEPLAPCSRFPVFPSPFALRPSASGRLPPANCLPPPGTSTCTWTPRTTRTITRDSVSTMPETMASSVQKVGVKPLLRSVTAPRKPRTGEGGAAAGEGGKVRGGERETPQFSRSPVLPFSPSPFLAVSSAANLRPGLPHDQLPLIVGQAGIKRFAKQRLDLLVA